MTRKKRRPMFGPAALAAVCALGAMISLMSPNPPALAKDSSGSATTPASQAGPAAPLTAQDVGPWLDGFMPHAIKSGDIAGAVVVVVKDGQVLTERGYGYSDVAKRTPVDPKYTLFRPGSISKLFTWTAVMQLVEAGKLNLDADVNTYIDFRIPPLHGKPVTLRNLMTHTAGFEEVGQRIITTNPDNFVPLDVVIKRWTPTRVFDAGTTPAYSNYASALAGYIVQRVSGQRFEDYVEQHILAPLDMRHATFRQPLPAALQPEMGPGYEQASLPPRTYEYVSMAPAGSLAATGEDMAHFMIAHLQNGRYGADQILKPETALQMHTSLTQLMPPLNGIELGFYEQNINGHEVISHGGATDLFNSNLWLFTHDNVGLFISMNSAGKPGAIRQIENHLFENFSDRYFPGNQVDGRVDQPTAIAHANLVAGYYRSSRAGFDDFVALLDLISPVVVVAAPNGDIIIANKRYHEISPFLYREENGHDRLKVVVENGRVTRFGNDRFGFANVFLPAPAATSPGWLVAADMVSLTVLVATLVMWPVAVGVRRHYGVSFRLAGRRAMSYRLVRIGIIVALAAIGAWAWVVTQALDPAAGSIVPYIHIAHLLTFLGFGGGLLVSLFDVREVFSGPSSGFGKLSSLAVALSFAVLVWTAWSYGLMATGTYY